jgi:CRP/FNR family transcriptional regulator
LLLYNVGPGTSCIQTTLGLMGGEAYSGEAVAETDVELAMIPAPDFAALLDASKAFRAHVFQSFGARMADVTRTLERVAFVRVEARLAARLLSEADGEGFVRVTHGDLAVAIGSAREVVTRRLEALAKRGIVAVERGAVHLLDRTALQEIRDAD